MKEFPYIKFNVNQWLTGTIAFQRLDVQGAYMKVCCYYWSKGCDLPRDHFKAIVPEYYNTLLKTNLIKVVEGKIIIEWLDDMYKDNLKRSKINAANGRKGGLKKAFAKDSLIINKIKENKIKDPYLDLQPEVLEKLKNLKNA